LLPSGRQRGIAFVVPDDWTPQQALAVYYLVPHQQEGDLAAHLLLTDLLKLTSPFMRGFTQPSTGAETRPEVFRIFN
jgi:hypothetical protein